MFDVLNNKVDQNLLVAKVNVMIGREKIYFADSVDKNLSSMEAPPSSPVTVVEPNERAYEYYDPSSNKDGFLGPSIRREVTQWMYRVIDHYSFDRNIVAVGMNYFIRYTTLSSPTNAEKQETLELATATSLYLAIKLYGPRLTKYDNLLLNFVRMSNSRFDSHQITNMEMEMLTALSWNVHPVTPQDYIPYFIQILSQNHTNLGQEEQKVLTELSTYIVELIVFNPRFTYDTPSSLACAGIAIALKGINVTPSSSSQAQIDYLQPLFNHGFVHYSTIHDLVESLKLYLTNITPMLDEEKLDIEPTGTLYKRIVSPR